jgi:hypothetical protein
MAKTHATSHIDTGKTEMGDKELLVNDINHIFKVYLVLCSRAQTAHSLRPFLNSFYFCRLCSV